MINCVTEAWMALPTTVGGLGTAGEMRIPASATAHNTANHDRVEIAIPRLISYWDEPILEGRMLKDWMQVWRDMGEKFAPAA